MPFSFEESIGRMIYKAHLKLRANLLKRLEPYGITTEQWEMLNYLWLEDGMCQKDLAAKIGKDQTNAARIAEKLEKKGWIERMPHPADRRAYRMFLTEEGKALKAVLHPQVEALLERHVRGIPPEDVESFKRTLKRIVQNAGDASAEEQEQQEVRSK